MEKGLAGDQEADVHSSLALLSYMEMGETYLQHSTYLGFMAEWPESSLSSVKTHENPLGWILSD